MILNNGLDGRFQKSTNKLQSLALNLTYTPSREISPSIFPDQNLKHLCMNGPWKEDMLCEILKESPGLRYLELSYHSGSWERSRLEQVCTKYHQLGGIPLGLEIVVLGRGLYLRLPEEAFSPVTGIDGSAKASYLSLLTDPARVREMRITATKGIAWATFDTSFFPNMDRLFLFSYARFERSVLRFFAMPKGRDFLRQVHLHVDGGLFKRHSYLGGRFYSSDFF